MCLQSLPHTKRPFPALIQTSLWAFKPWWEKLDFVMQLSIRSVIIFFALSQEKVVTPWEIPFKVCGFVKVRGSEVHLLRFNVIVCNKRK